MLMISEDGTVTDEREGLMWKRDEEMNPAREDGLFNFEEACKAKSAFAGFDDWRLPTSHELLLLANHNFTNHTLQLPKPTRTGSTWFWSSMEAAFTPDLAWSVDFYNRKCYRRYRGSPQRVQLVRDLHKDSN